MIKRGSIGIRPTGLSVAPTQASVFALTTCGIAMSLVFACIAYLSRFFSFETPQVDRPLVAVLVLFGIAFCIYIYSIWVALRHQSRKLFGIIFGFAILFRVLLVGSKPIQEIDIYRYVWDGVATVNGVSPFDFTPKEVLAADASVESPELRRLVRARDSAPAIRTLLERVHFPGLPTVYPPVSQVVFALATSTTPAYSSPAFRITVMKLWLLVFDVGTIIVLAATLRRVGLHLGWLVSYAWCPLVLKEFANSGHLDSIAVFLSALAVYLGIRAFFPAEQNVARSQADLISAVLAAGVLGLGVGAKLYPVVLVPLMAATALRRFGAMKTAALGGVWLVVTSASLVPMLRATHRPSTTSSPNRFTTVSAAETGSLGDAMPEELPELTEESIQPHQQSSFQPGDRTAGLKKFLSYWMMNDFLFLNIAENVTPDHLRDGKPTPWFVFVPDPAREQATKIIENRFGIDEARVPFVIARTLTGITFVCLCFHWAFRSWSTCDAVEWGECVFLTMAWFWLLLPTLNPWYWIWALPWIAFAKNRTWLFMSGLLFIYYLRFFFSAHFDAVRVVDWLPYGGEAFFDYVVVWFEYLPWFLLLALTYWRGDRVKSSEQSIASAIPDAGSVR